MKLFNAHMKTKAEPPGFSLIDLIHKAMRLSSLDGRSPVRYLSLGGDKPRARTGQKWNPSSVRGCARKAVYKAHGVKPYTGYEVSVEDQMVFDRGTVIGAWVAAYLRALEDYGVVSNVRAQVEGRDEVLAVRAQEGLGGFVDIIFTYDGQDYIVEVKSKDNDTALDKLNGPSEDHLGQLNDYMRMTDIHSGWVLYAGLSENAKGRQTLRFKEFPHAFSWALWDNTERRTSSLNQLLNVPNRMPPGSSNKFFECPTCPYRAQCDGGLTPAEAKTHGSGT